MSNITAISISARKGVRKKNIDSTILFENHGLENDAHAGKWHRQVSFLAEESIEKMRARGLDVVAGNFAENITTEGVDLVNILVGTHLNIGQAELILSQIGKICHNRCAIYHQAGDCVMPKEGVFGIVIKSGNIRVGDTIHIQKKRSPSAAIISTREVEQAMGERLRQIVTDIFAPAFIRLDLLTSKKGGNLTAILQDLTSTQRTDNIFVFNPSGSEALAFTGYPRLSDRQNSYKQNTSIIHYCRTVEELEQL